MALGDRDGEVEIEVSAESDMSSVLPQTELLRRISPTSRVIGRETVPLRRLDGLAEDMARARRRRLPEARRPGLRGAGPGRRAPAAERLKGVQLEMALVPCYEGERDFRVVLDDLAAAGFGPFLFIPGYFERKLARQLQIDGVFMRERG